MPISIGSDFSGLESLSRAMSTLGDYFHSSIWLEKRNHKKSKLLFHLDSQPLFSLHPRKTKLPYRLEFISEMDDSLRALTRTIHKPKLAFKDL